jgi:hypothetical protein
MNFFFGIEVLPGKNYKSMPPDGSFLHVSQAALPADAKEGRVSLKATVDQHTYVLCTLNAGHTDQCPLDLNFSAGREVVFSTTGAPVPVHITGYFEAIEDEEFMSDEEGMMFGEEGEESEMDEESEEEQMPAGPPAKKFKTEPDVKNIPIADHSQKNQKQQGQGQGQGKNAKKQGQQGQQAQQAGSQSPNAKPAQAPKPAGQQQQQQQQGGQQKQKGQGQQQQQGGQKQQQQGKPQQQQGGQQGGQGADGEGKKKKRNRNKNKNKGGANQ